MRPENQACVVSKSNLLALRLGRLKSGDEFEKNSGSLVFIFAKGGVGHFVAESPGIQLVPGDVLMMNVMASAKLMVVDAQEEFVYWTFSIDFQNLMPLFDNDEISLLHHIMKCLPAGKIYPAESHLAKECHRLLAVVPAQFNLDHRGQLLRIAATLLSEECKEKMLKLRGGYREGDRVVKAFANLSTSELMELPVSELAGRFSCSRRHLSRLFHQRFGVSASGLKMEMRMLKAISLLRDSEARVTQVAGKCGFKHLGLFIDCFKRRFGTSPGEWQRLILTASRTRSCNFPARTKAAAMQEGEGSLTDHLGELIKMTPFEEADGADCTRIVSGHAQECRRVPRSETPGKQ